MRVFVRLRISSPRIKPVASNFARWFIGVFSRESHILDNFVVLEAYPEAQIRTNRPARGLRELACALVSQRVARALADSTSSLVTRRIGMCGYTVVPEDESTCLSLSVNKAYGLVNGGF